MRAFIASFALALVAGCSISADRADPASDAPERERPRVVFKDAPSHGQALRLWRTPEDVNAWIAANFRYDTARAMALSEGPRGRSGASLPIHSPPEFFSAPSGICVDLSRFAVETLQQLRGRAAKKADPSLIRIM